MGSMEIFLYDHCVLHDELICTRCWTVKKHVILHVLGRHGDGVISSASPEKGSDFEFAGHLKNS